MPAQKREKNQILLLSTGIDAIPVVEGNRTVLMLHGAINGQAFQVRCDELTFVTDEVAEVLKPLLDRQQKRTTSGF
ncbi:MAG: hypothetical protein K2X01_11965 [Cyanobacteria bacterium]|nr:hypothetical protein [Cyanobacteriota bacterium]